MQYLNVTSCPKESLAAVARPNIHSHLRTEESSSFTKLMSTNNELKLLKDKSELSGLGLGLGQP